jgi:hypothetical protein
MLDSFMNAIPNLFAAAVIIGIAYVLAKFVSGLVADILDGLGFNQLPAKLGLTSLANEGGFQVSSLAGRIVSFFIMLFAAVEAANRLEFTQVSEVVTMFIKFGGQIVLGAVILAVGVWLANLVHGAILRVSGDQSRGMASIGRFAILGLVAAMGLRAMGIADDIVNMAFALTLGSIAVAIALSFGLGGREAAGKQMEYWLSKYRR